MFNPSRDEARRFLADAWRKHRAGQPLTGLETMAAGDRRAHPEYHAMLEAPERHLDRDWRPESGDDQSVPAPVAASRRRRAAVDRPAARHPRRSTSGSARRSGDEHAALHAVLECLGEVVWAAQRHGTPPDAALYLACLARQR